MPTSCSGTSTAADARRALQSKEVGALLLVAPLTERHLAWIKGLFRESASALPVLIPVDAAGAIADRKGPYESFDIPKGTLRGAPPVPDDDLTTLRVGYYLVANRHLNANVMADLARKVMSVRRDLVGEQPLLSGVAAPDLDADAFLPVHPGAAALLQRHAGELFRPLQQFDLHDAHGARRTRLDLRRCLAISRRACERGNRGPAGVAMRSLRTDQAGYR